MNDKEPIPTPEQFANAARTLAEARIAHEEAKREEQRARNAECAAGNRVAEAERVLRQMTDRLVPREARGRMVG